MLAALVAMKYEISGGGDDTEIFRITAWQWELLADRMVPERSPDSLMQYVIRRKGFKQNGMPATIRKMFRFFKIADPTVSSSAHIPFGYLNGRLGTAEGTPRG